MPPRTSRSIPDRLTELEQLKIQFGADAAVRVAKLLKEFATTRLTTVREVIRLHEAVLFLRAYPHDEMVLTLADEILFGFQDRVGGMDPWELEEGEVSGIAGTAVSTAFSYPFARRLVDRHGDAIRIDYENYPHPERLGPVLAKLIPLVAEDWNVEPHIDWREWFERAGGSLKWLLHRLDPVTYDSLEMPVTWNVGTSDASRSRTRIPIAGGKPFYQTGPLIKRSEVSIHAEIAASPLTWKTVPKGTANRMLNAIIDTSAVRYRELWGFLYPDVERMDHVRFGRGVEMIWFGVPKEWRMPLRAYHCGMFFKNGVPIGYVETLSLFERMEVGFNLYYTFREGESAWLYAKLLKWCHQRYGVTCFSVDPYQIGHENEEAVASGAFWFYRKLGFRPASAETAELTASEERKMARAARSGKSHRSSAATLRKLAVAPVMFDTTGAAPPDWDGFSLHRLLERVARAGNPGTWDVVIRAIGRNAKLRNEPTSEPTGDELLRAKLALDEEEYLRLLQRSPKLRQGFLALGRA